MCVFMLFRSNKAIADGLIEQEYKGDKFVFTHAQKIDPVLNRVELLRKNTDKGWTQQKEFKLIASVPTIEYLNHPEWYHDDAAFVKWLNTDYGSQFKVSNP